MGIPEIIFDNGLTSDTRGVTEDACRDILSAR